VNKLFKVYADWCGPCKVMTDILKDIDTEGEFNTTLIDVNADLDKEFLVEHNIRSIPYFILQDSEGNTLRTHQGAMTLHNTRRFLAGT